MDPELPHAEGRTRRETVARRRRRMASTTLAGLLLVGGGGWALSYTSLFRADDIQVTGTERLPVRRVLRLAGVNETTNVVHFDSGDAERRLEASPWIARAAVERRLPDRIEISVVERFAVARWKDPASHRTMLVTDGGTLAPGSSSARLPALVDWLGTSQLSAGERTLAARALADLTAVLRSTVMQAALGPDGRLLLRLRDGATVTYGAASEIRGKGEALAAVLAWASKNEATLGSIDLQVPTAPTARLDDGSVFQPPA
jgi:cell division protein FtsQ